MLCKLGLMADGCKRVNRPHVLTSPFIISVFLPRTFKVPARTVASESSGNDFEVLQDDKGCNSQF